MTRRVSATKHGRGHAAMPAHVKPKAGRSAAVRHGSRSSVDNDDEAEVVQQSDDDYGIRLPVGKRRRSSSRRNPHRQAVDDDEVYSPSQDSDNEQGARPPQHKRRRLGSPRPACAIVAGRQRSSNYGSTGSRQVQIPSSPPSQYSGTQESAKALSAKFTEWLLETAFIRSAVVDGVTTFQLQFKADLYCSKHKRHMLQQPTISLQDQLASQVAQLGARVYNECCLDARQNSSGFPVGQ